MNEEPVADITQNQLQIVQQQVKFELEHGQTI